MRYRRAGVIGGLLATGMLSQARAGPRADVIAGVAAGTESWAAVAVQATIAPDPLKFLQWAKQPWLFGLRLRAEAGLASGAATLGLTAIDWNVHGSGFGDVELNARLVQRWWLARRAPQTCAGGELAVTLVLLRIAAGAIRCPSRDIGDEWLPTISATFNLLGFGWDWSER